MAHFLSINIIQKLKKFYQNQEERFNALEDEDAAKKYLERESEEECVCDDISISAPADNKSAARRNSRVDAYIQSTMEGEIVNSGSPVPAVLQDTVGIADNMEQRIAGQGDQQSLLGRQQIDLPITQCNLLITHERKRSCNDNCIDYDTQNLTATEDAVVLIPSHNDIDPDDPKPGKLLGLDPHEDTIRAKHASLPQLELGSRTRRKSSSSKSSQKRKSSTSVLMQSLHGFVSATIGPSRLPSGQGGRSAVAFAKAHTTERQAIVCSESGGDGACCAEDQFGLLLRQRSASNLSWYLKPGVHRIALALVVGLCFCLWLLPIRNYPYYINIANLIRGVRRSGADVLLAVFTTRELIIADGFSRSNTSALYAAAIKYRTSMQMDTDAFRLGGYVASEGNTIRFGADQLGINDYDTIMYQACSSDVVHCVLLFILVCLFS